MLREGGAKYRRVDAPGDFDVREPALDAEHLGEGEVHGANAGAARQDQGAVDVE